MEDEQRINITNYKSKYRGEPLYTVYGPKLLEEMTWAEVADALKETDIVLPLVGAVENHGPHCPLKSDNIQAVEVAKRAAIKLAAEGIKVVIGPLIPFGDSAHHMGFPGTITMRPGTAEDLLKDVLNSLILHGFRKICVISGHGGNPPFIYHACQEIYDKHKIRIASPDWMRVIFENWEPPVRKTNTPEREFHQGERGTSLTLAGCPELVDMSKAVASFAPEVERRRNKYGWWINVPYLMAYDTKAVAPMGHIGDATLATKEEGDYMLDKCGEYIADFVKEEFVARRDKPRST